MQQREFHFSDQNGPLTMAYTEWGDSHNPRVALCVHGLTRHSRDFDYLASALSGEYRVLCLDMVGRGHSSWLTDKMQYSIAHYAGHIAQFLAAMKLSKVDWIGTSMGGMIAFVMAGINPHIFHKLVLNDVGPFLPQASLQRIGDYVGGEFIYADLDDAMAAFKKIYANFGITNEEHWRHFVIHSVRGMDDGRWRLHYDPGIAAPFKAIAAMGDLELWPLWQNIACPTLILRGQKSDLLTAQTAQKMLARDNRVTLLEFENIGHAPSLMDEGQISVVKNWLLA